MKLKRRLTLAYVEFGLGAAVLLGLLTIDFTSPRGLLGFAGVGVSAMLSAFIVGPVCYASWKRIAATRAAIAERGPDAEISAEWWLSPRLAGVFGVAILVAALGAALAPALLAH